MKTGTTALLFVLLTVSVLVGPVAAETIYVGDRLIVGIRELPQDGSASLGSLKSDTALELIEEGEVYFKVKTADGKVGYIKKHYLSKDRPKSLIIADLEKKLAAARKESTRLKESINSSESASKQQLSVQNEQVAELQQILDKANSELTALGKELEQVRQQYETLKKDSGDVVAIVNQREKLTKENARLTDDLNTLRDENAFLLSTGVIKWLFAGASILFVGWVIGKSSRRKRSF